MGESTGIQWTDHTFNPWWGCARVAKGCEHCYAEAFAKRTGHKVWGASERRFFGDKHWAEPLRWNEQAKREGARRLVFCASMADVFEDRPELDEHRARLFELIRATPHLVWQLLTKRPENILRFAPLPRLPNVWYGASAATQAELARNVQWLRVLNATTFVSLEPLIERVVFHYDWLLGHGAIDWVIVGGESGPGARPFDLAWASLLIQQCSAADVPLFFKQAGARPTIGGKPLSLKDRKGGDLAELSSLYNVRQFPRGLRRAA
jgi:protein gp37